MQFGTKCHQSATKLRIKFVLKIALILLGIEDLGFVLFEIGRYVALGIGESLLANIIGRHQSLIGIGHFDVIAESLIEVDFQALDAGALLFALLKIFNPLLAAAEQIAHFISSLL